MCSFAFPPSFNINTIADAFDSVQYLLCVLLTLHQSTAAGVSAPSQWLVAAVTSSLTGVTFHAQAFSSRFLHTQDASAPQFPCPWTSQHCFKETSPSVSASKSSTISGSAQHNLRHHSTSLWTWKTETTQLSEEDAK
ncbi:hypothetical protein CPB83DRAFT_849714 [Crepidotus variabilis]|uniref:Uncharacterized protein n=1 Tax=Crepidotus variabilis TaxID=179855 RepID=A0A9P6ELK0_9AGAR|nr:hypothetical protein CPB83DRAFT_849714 [Crepidotus variabilis]